MEFFQRNQRTILIVLAVLVGVVLFCKYVYDCNKLNPFNKGEGYQGNHTLGGRGLVGRGLTAEKLIPVCYKAKENHYMK
jgi:hypothetical protein